jgi:two-component system sensor histidine kinase/response regulator
MGLGIWSMHFVAMLALQLPQPITYNGWLTFLSLACAIAASSIALQISSREATTRRLLLAGGACMGTAIASMHYIGMAAMQLHAQIHYNLTLVGLSVAIAMLTSTTALSFLFRKQQTPPKISFWSRLGAAFMLGGAISGMHYTGMAATHFIPQIIPQANDKVERLPAIDPYWLAIVIGVATLLILSMAMLTALFDQRLATQLVREESLRESEKRFRRLIREIKVGVLLLNDKAEILTSNPAAIELLGLQNVDLKVDGSPVVFGDGWHVIREDGTPFAIAELPVQQAIAQRQSIHDVVLAIDHTPQSDRRWLLVNADPQIGDDGQIERVVCTLNDIGDRKRIELTLQHNAERESTISRAIQRIRQTLDLQSIFIATTQELRQALRCDRVVIYRFQPDWSGEFVAESVAPGWISLLQQADAATVTEQSVDEENCAVKAFGATQTTIKDVDTYLQETQGGVYQQGATHLSVNDVEHAGFEPCYLERLQRFQARAYITVPIFCGDVLWGLLASYQNSGPRQWQEAEIGIVTQIGSQLGVAVQQAELLARTQQQAKELQAAKERADAASRAKTDFLARMSHELRTPLNAILGFTQLMQDDPTLVGEHQQYISIVSRSGEHLLNLINDVLEMSKIEAGRATLDSQPFDLYQLLENLNAMLQLKAVSKRLQLMFEYDPSVPQQVKTDGGKLRQVLINLLGNAIKFTDAGRVILRVKAQRHTLVANSLATVEAHSSASSCTLFFEVEDTGPGIASTELEKLFEVFGQTEVGRKSPEGTGLGLPISQTFVRLMGGDITVNSQLGMGSIFCFHIKAEIVDPFSQLIDPPDRQIIVTLAPNQPKYRILVAEDSSTNRLLLVKLLTSVGFDVREASNGEEALQQWEQWQPHLIWMDIHMPTMKIDGYEAIKSIKASARGQSTVIIALTADAFEEQRQAVLAAGCDDFMIKPFRKDAVLAKMSQHLGVEYLYETSAQASLNQQVNSLQPIASPYRELSSGPMPSIARRSLTNGTSLYDVSSSSLSTALKTMPQPWLEQLDCAASQCSDRLVLELIEQIPESECFLATHLKNLTENFRFDQILTLIQMVFNSQENI